MKRTLKFTVGILTSLLVLGCIVSCDLFSPTTRPEQISSHVTLGIPDKVSSTNPSNKDHYLMVKKAYVVSYNNTDHIPNWVSWNVQKEHIGSKKRPPFEPDTSLPSGFDRVETRDYSWSGMDRGHMCPNRARAGISELQKETFLMTNIVPQNHRNNAGAWEVVEAMIQDAVYYDDDGKNPKEAYVISGTYGVGGETGDSNQSIAAGQPRYYIESRGMRIKVPAITWKVAIIMPKGDNDLERLNSIGSEGGLSIDDIQIYGIWMPNNESVSDDYEDSLKSIDFIEKMTGYDFFSELDDFVEARIEALNNEYDALPVPGWKDAV